MCVSCVGDGNKNKIYIKLVFSFFPIYFFRCRPVSHVVIVFTTKTTTVIMTYVMLPSLFHRYLRKRFFFSRLNNSQYQYLLLHVQRKKKHNNHGPFNFCTSFPGYVTLVCLKRNRLTRQVCSLLEKMLCNQTLLTKLGKTQL